MLLRGCCFGCRKLSWVLFRVVVLGRVGFCNTVGCYVYKSNASDWPYSRRILNAAINMQKASLL